MPKAKGKSRRKKYDYKSDRKKLKRKMLKKTAPRIECTQIRKAWNIKKTVAQNLADMGLASDPNHAIPIKNNKQMKMETASKDGKQVIIKPYVIKELEAEASLPEVKNTTLSKELIDFVRHMVENYKDNYKAMARDERNYYQDTPNQIKNKIASYKRFYPSEYNALVTPLQEKMDLS
ncbi:nucleolar protein 16 [Carcharodon carcharias]|uniref:nucleolar protein 16 n=1 Tax=Carcharodon carcharias TaxID=13397 RepID=UPI001B7E076D|nr:nucleolar protein 16 [Carcharodon carcharias]